MEVLSYAGSKAAIESWLGNVREMHENVAVGRDVEREFDDESRTITVTARISEGAPVTWEKIQDGTLRFLSAGGRTACPTCPFSARSDCGKSNLQSRDLCALQVEQGA